MLEIKWPISIALLCVKPVAETMPNLVSTAPFQTNFNEIWIKIWKFLLRKRIWKYLQHIFDFNILIVAISKQHWEFPEVFV